VKTIFITIFLLSQLNLLASTDCSSLATCIESISKISGKKYVYNPSILKGDIKLTENMQITAENADQILSTILENNDLTRLAIDQSNNYQIVSARDVRYQYLPMLKIDLAQEFSIPKSNDFFLATVNLNKLDQRKAKDITGSLRPFM